MNVIESIAKIPELRRRILFTLGMMAVYRLGIFVTVPGVNRDAMREFVQSQQGVLGMFNLFSGGALEQMSIFALNIMPYVSASIIFSLLTVVIKPLEELRKEGEAGQRKINQYTRYGTVAISIVQGFAIAQGLEGQTTGTGTPLVSNPGFGFQMMTLLTLTTGTSFLMWLGEQINERGLGNGISLIIFAGIVAAFPDAIRQTYNQVELGQLQPIDLVLITAAVLGLIAFIVFMERAQRQIPVTYTKRTVGRKVYGGQQTHLPLKVNLAGVIPPIFASTLLMLPMSFGQNSDLAIMQWFQATFAGGTWPYIAAFGGMTIFFTYFYVSITIQPVEMADNLKKQNAFVPGIRPGKATAEYLTTVIGRLTTAGALYLAAVCTVPTIAQSNFGIPFYLGGTSLIIVVGVALDFAQQIESHMITRHYEGLTGGDGPKIRAREKAA